MLRGQLAWLRLTRGASTHISTAAKWAPGLYLYRNECNDDDGNQNSNVHGFSSWKQVSDSESFAHDLMEFRANSDPGLGNAQFALINPYIQVYRISCSDENSQNQDPATEFGPVAEFGLEFR